MTHERRKRSAATAAAALTTRTSAWAGVWVELSPVISAQVSGPFVHSTFWVAIDLGHNGSYGFDLPSDQVRDDEDEFAHVERFRQVSLIAGDKGALSILCSRKGSES